MSLPRSPIHQYTLPCGPASYTHYYLCHYLPVSTGRDILSHSLLKFKEGRQPDLDGWIDCSLEMLNGLILPHTTIIRALHHKETDTREDPPVALDRLGQALADRFHSHYRPALLRKSRPTRQIKGFSTARREAELQDLYSLNIPAIPVSPGPDAYPAANIPSLRYSLSLTPGNTTPFFIIDDILTTATTIRAIISAIHARCPGAAISSFSLARAAYETAPDNVLPVKGRHYQWEPGMDWILAE